MSTDGEHLELQESLGAYALGQLDPIEADRVRAHLDGCAACRADADEIAPVVAALAAARVQQGADAPELPADLVGMRIAAGIRAERRSSAGRFGRTAATAAIASAAAAAVFLVGLRISAPDPAPAAPVEAVQVTRQVPGVDASAGLIAHTWGIEVQLRATGLEQGARYDVTVIGADGSKFPAGAFVGTGANPVRCNLNAGVLRESASAFEVRDRAGRLVLASRFAA